MRKSVYMSVAAAALLLAGAALFGLPGREAVAQASGVYVNAVDLDIKPGDVAKFIEAVKENGAAAVKEPGCREFNITVLAKDPNHVFLYEVYDNEAALNSHRATDHFKKFAATTADMVAKRDVRGMSVIAFNAKSH
jgi:(4S)-4-hydroxy-5-phosphonooxypentane-2,3-dione isomerase